MEKEEEGLHKRHTKHKTASMMCLHCAEKQFNQLQDNSSTILPLHHYNHVFLSSSSVAGSMKDILSK